VAPLDKTKLATAPKYREDSEPTYDKDYGSRINNYYVNY
jgi:hypothetical protein